MSLDLKIYIATHKKFEPPKEGFFKPIHVGKSLKEDLGFDGDDTGESISHKNPNFCELTALYWAWKNDDSEYLGLCHYRRYFDFENKKDRINDIQFISDEEFKEQSFSKETITKYLSKFDLILAKPKVYELSVEQVYGYNHSSIDYHILTETLNEMYPDYSASWTKVSHKNNKLIHYNMFIAHREVVNAYCEWLFPLLFEVEKRVQMSPNKYQQRVFGFMAERLMTLYFTHHNFNIKYLPVLYVKEDVFPFKTPSKTKQFVANLYKNFLFLLSSFPKKNRS